MSITAYMSQYVMGSDDISGKYTGQQKKRIFCIFGIVYKLGFKYSSYYV